MMEIKCLIIDDEPIACEIIESYISKLSSFTLLGKFSSAIDAIEFLKNNTVDLIFLDIQMPEITGFQFLDIWPKNAQVILTTAHREFALDAYDYHVLDYLLKPISFERFMRAIQKYKIEKGNNFIFLKIDKRNEKVEFDSIHYIEGLGNYVNVITQAKQHIVYMRLIDLEKILPKNKFLRIHKSYIVSINKINSFSKKNIVLNKKDLPIGQFYKKAVLQQLENI